MSSPADTDPSDHDPDERERQLEAFARQVSAEAASAAIPRAPPRPPAPPPAPPSPPRSVSVPPPAVHSAPSTAPQNSGGGAVGWIVGAIVILFVIVAMINAGTNSSDQYTIPEEPIYEAAPAEAPADPAAVTEAPADYSWLQSETTDGLRGHMNSGASYANAARNEFNSRAYQAFDSARASIGQLLVYQRNWPDSPYFENARSEQAGLVSAGFVSATKSVWATQTTDMRNAPSSEGEFVQYTSVRSSYYSYGRIQNEGVTWYVFNDSSGRRIYARAASFSDYAPVSVAPQQPPPVYPQTQPQRSVETVSFAGIWSEEPSERQRMRVADAVGRVRTTTIIRAECTVLPTYRLDCRTYDALTDDQRQAIVDLLGHYRAPATYQGRSTVGMRTILPFRFEPQPH